MGEGENILVVCTAGQQRSPTTARLLEENYDVSAKAVGVHPQAEVHVTQDDIDWAEQIIAMNEQLDSHKTYLKEHFDLKETPVTVFGIPDRYFQDDPELVSILEDRLENFMTGGEGDR